MTNTPPGQPSDWSSYPAPQPYLSWVDTSGTTNGLTFDVVTEETWTEGADVTENPVEKGANVTDHVRVRLSKCELKVFATNEPIDANNFAQAVTAPTDLDVPTPSWVPGSGILIVPEVTNPIELRALAGSLIGLVGGVSGVGGAIGGLAVAGLGAALLPPIFSEKPVVTDAGLLPPTPTIITPTVQQWSSPADFVEQTHAQMLALKDAAQILQVFGTKQVNFAMVIDSVVFVRNVDTGTGESLTIGLTEIRVVSTQVVPAPIPNLPAGAGKPPGNHGGQNPKDAPPKQQSAALAALKRFAPDVAASLPPATP